MNEEEAIEILKRIDIKFFLSGMNEQSNYIVDEADKVNKAIETVLNLLEKKDEEIEKYKMMLAENCARTLNSNLKQKHKHEEDLEALHLGWKEEIEKKDKIIDEMAYCLSEFDIDEMCEKCERCIGNGCYANDDMEFKINCIKQYYERKIENEN